MTPKNNAQGSVTKVAGPVVHAQLHGAINDLVRVGDEELLGEIIEVRGDTCVIQVYEDTTGVAPGDAVINTKQPLEVELGPGILGMVYDGTQRPLANIKASAGTFIQRGIQSPALDETRKWSFEPAVENGAELTEGDVIGTVEENATIIHRVLVPPGISGKASGLKKGAYTIREAIGKVGSKNVHLAQRWPVRKARPVQRAMQLDTPLISGTRVVDFLFPVGKGGAAAIPGPFGAGKTVTQQQFAKWCDADIIVYIGCGERGNEMTEVLTEFPHLQDPKNGQPLMNRTILIANTSNMPVAAREASVYTGITIAEYFRDQGYAVALMADSTSRWAEAMREISGRLEEMPGEEGYPAYLAKRLAEFYERAGPVKTLGGSEGSITIVGAVSPPGGDFSEPVTQNTLRLTRCFWALDAKLADRRHFPSFNWMQSYSLYVDTLAAWYREHVSEEWNTLRRRTQQLLQEESELQEIAQLVGVDALAPDQQAALLAARMVREDFLQQNAFHEEDTFCPLPKQLFMISAIFAFYDTITPDADKLDMDALRRSEASQLIAGLKYEPNATFTDATAARKLQSRLSKALEKALQEARA